MKEIRVNYSKCKLVATYDKEEHPIYKLPFMIDNCEHVLVVSDTDTGKITLYLIDDLINDEFEIQDFYSDSGSDTGKDMVFDIRCKNKALDNTQSNIRSSQ